MMKFFAIAALGICCSCDEVKPLPQEQFQTLAMLSLDSPNRSGIAEGVRFEAKDAQGNPLKEVYYTAELVFLKKEIGDEATLRINFYHQHVADSLKLTRPALDQPFYYVYHFPTEMGSLTEWFIYKLVLNNNLLRTVRGIPPEKSESPK